MEAVLVAPEEAGEGDDHVNGGVPDGYHVEDHRYRLANSIRSLDLSARSRWLTLSTVSRICLGKESTPVYAPAIPPTIAPMVSVSPPMLAVRVIVFIGSPPPAAKRPMAVDIASLLEMSAPIW